MCTSGGIELLPGGIAEKIFSVTEWRDNGLIVRQVVMKQPLLHVPNALNFNIDPVVKTYWLCYGIYEMAIPKNEFIINQ